MSASQELEKAATAYALDAVKMDKQGNKGRAITLYQKAIETLLQLVQLYPEYGLNKVYVQRAIAYQERIKALQGSVSTLDVRREMERDAQENGGRIERATPEGKDESEELIVTEKPMVKWESPITATLNPALPSERIALKLFRHRPSVTRAH